MDKESSWTLFSPDKNIQVDLELNDGRLTYTVQSEGVPVINAPAMGVSRSDADLTSGLSFVEKSQTEEFNESISLHTGITTKITDNKAPNQLITTVSKESGNIMVDILPYGGFVLKLTPASNPAFN